MPTDSHRIAHAVAQLNRRLRQERHSELTPTQLSVLGAVLALEQATPRAIADHERVQPPSITRTLACLADDGLIAREPHPDDGRQVLISISEKGKDVLAAERGRRDLWLAQQLEMLSPTERKTLREAAALLQQLASS